MKETRPANYELRQRENFTAINPRFIQSGVQAEPEIDDIEIPHRLYGYARAIAQKNRYVEGEKVAD